MRAFSKEMFFTAWRWWTHAAGILLLALMVSFGLVEVFAGDGPVIQRIGNIDHVTTVTHVHGAISYDIDTNRLESCPGDPIITLKSRGESRIVVRIPSTPIAATSLNPGIRPTTKITLILPPEIGPGDWTYEGGIQSYCPTRRHFDSLVKFDFKVLP